MIVLDRHVAGPLWQQKIYYYGKKLKQTWNWNLRHRI